MTMTNWNAATLVAIGLGSACATYDDAALGEEDIGAASAPVIDEGSIGERGLRYFDGERWYHLEAYHPRADFTVAFAGDTCSQARNNAALACAGILSTAILDRLRLNPWILTTAQLTTIRNAIAAVLGGASFMSGWRCGRAIANEFRICQVGFKEWLNALALLYRTHMCTMGGICWPDRELVDFWFEMSWIIRDYIRSMFTVTWDYDVCTCAYDGGGNVMAGSDGCCPHLLEEL